MALVVDYLDVWKWMNISGTLTYNFYWKMFNPNVNEPTSWTSISVINSFSNVDLTWFQQWLEVWVACADIRNTWGSAQRAVLRFQQDRWWSYSKTFWRSTGYIQPWESWLIYMYRWVDPDEIRPSYTNYKVTVEVGDTWEEIWSKSFSISNLSFDTTPHPLWYLWVEWANLCYIPRSENYALQAWWFKHKIAPDTWYSWSNVWASKAGYIWIPSSSSDHHIYYVNEYGIVSRTKESYERYWWAVHVDGNKQWYIRIPSSTLAEDWYNYLCYIDWWWYKRRMWVWEL